MLKSQIGISSRILSQNLSQNISIDYRFRRFNGENHGALELRAARSSFSLIVRIVDWLIDSDFHAADVMGNLSDFIAELVGGGELLLARALRSKFIEKYEEHRTRLLPDLDFGRLVLVTSSKLAECPI